MSSGVSRGGRGPRGSLGSAEQSARWQRCDSEPAELNRSRAALRAAARAAQPGRHWLCPGPGSQPVPPGEAGDPWLVTPFQPQELLGGVAV